MYSVDPEGVQELAGRLAHAAAELGEVAATADCALLGAAALGGHAFASDYDELRSALRHAVIEGSSTFGEMARRVVAAAHSYADTDTVAAEAFS